MCWGTEAGSYLRLIDSCITQLKAQGPSRTCNESREEEEEEDSTFFFEDGLAYQPQVTILYEKSLNLKTISQGNLATLERII